jgi:hypothetical protein
MCNFWSCIITRDRRVIWNKDSNSHEEQIKKAGLKDDKLEDRDFVRIEISPKTREAIFSKKPADWALKVDEDKTLPAWFVKDRVAIDALLWVEWRKAMKATLWKLDLAAAEKFIKSIPKIRYFSMCGKLFVYDVAKKEARKK